MASRTKSCLGAALVVVFPVGFLLVWQDGVQTLRRLALGSHGEEEVIWGGTTARTAVGVPGSCRGVNIDMDASHLVFNVHS